MGFQHKVQEQHKLDGMVAALHSPDTPEHLREHIASKLDSEGVEHEWKVLSEEDAEPFRVLSEGVSPPTKGERLKLPGAVMGTVMFAHPTQNIIRIRADDGKNITLGLGSSLGRQIMAERSNRS